jgi:hypothetical protein
LLKLKRRKTMKVGLIVVLASALLGAQQPQVNVKITELPPEEVPAGNCSQSASGYLGIAGEDKSERTKLTDQEIGAYVRKRLAEGYSVALYPQASGKVFTVQTCHPAKP